MSVDPSCTNTRHAGCASLWSQTKFFDETRRREVNTLTGPMQMLTFSLWWAMTVARGDPKMSTELSIKLYLTCLTASSPVLEGHFFSLISWLHRSRPSSQSPLILVESEAPFASRVSICPPGIHELYRFRIMLHSFNSISRSLAGAAKFSRCDFPSTHSEECAGSGLCQGKKECPRGLLNTTWEPSMRNI